MAKITSGTRGTIIKLKKGESAIIFTQDKGVHLLSSMRVQKLMKSMLDSDGSEHNIGELMGDYTHNEFMAAKATLELQLEMFELCPDTKLSAVTATNYDDDRR